MKSLTVLEPVPVELQALAVDLEPRQTPLMMALRGAALMMALRGAALDDVGSFVGCVRQVRSLNWRLHETPLLHLGKRLSRITKESVGIDPT